MALQQQQEKCCSMGRRRLIVQRQLAGRPLNVKVAGTQSIVAVAMTRSLCTLAIISRRVYSTATYIVPLHSFLAGRFNIFCDMSCVE